MTDPEAHLGPFLDGIGDLLGEHLLGVHVVGAWALREDDEPLPPPGELAIVAVLDDPPSPDVGAALGRLHTGPGDAGSAWPRSLTGSYAPASDLRSPMTVGRRWLHVDGAGDPELSDVDNTVAARWVLRERGLRLLGAPAADLVVQVSPDAIRAEALGRARARAEQLEVDLDEGRHSVSRDWVLDSAAGLWAARHATVRSREVSSRWAVGQVESRLVPIIEAARTGVLDPDEPRWADLGRALAWDVVRLTGTWALERRAE